MGGDIQRRMGVGRTDFQGFADVTGIGSLPHTDAAAARDFVLRFAGTVPYWPQLPQRAPEESMISQFTEGLPALEGESTVNLSSPELQNELEGFYQRFLEGRAEDFAIGRQYAAALYALVEGAEALDSARALKGQVTGPVSFGLQMLDQEKRFLIYDDVYRDVLVKQIARKAAWLEGFLRQAAGERPVIIFFDEPLLYTYGSAYFNIPRKLVVDALVEGMAGLNGVKGIHACQNCDWSLLFDARPDVFSFDAHSYLEQFLIYRERAQDFVRGGGIIAWGVVPNTDGAYLKETAETLFAHLDDAFDALTGPDLSKTRIARQSLITPACGVGTLSIEHAHRVFELAEMVSRTIKDHYLA